MQFVRSYIWHLVWAVLVPLACTPVVRSLPSQPNGVRFADLPVPGAPVGITAFLDVAVIPMDQERVLAHQTVLVQRGRITALGPVAEVRVPAGSVRIDGRGQYLIPGLADMHVHLEGDSTSAERALFLLAANGVTTIRNMNAFPFASGHVSTKTDSYGRNSFAAFLLRLRARAAAGVLWSPWIYTSGPWGPKQYIGPVEYVGGPNVGSPSPVLDSVAAYIVAYKAAGYDFVKIHDEDRVMAESAAVAAHRVGLPVLGHVPENGTLEDGTLADAIAAGFASIEHLTGYIRALANGPRQLDLGRIPALAAATQRAGVWNCPTIELEMLLTRDDATVDTVEKWPEFMYTSPERLRAMRVRFKKSVNGPDIYGMQFGLDHMKTREILFQLVRALQNVGAGLLSGTDANDMGQIYEVPGFSLHRELAALVQAGLTPYQALETSTRNVAAYSGTLAERGTVAIGKRADLVLLAGNPLEDISQTTRIAGVMLGGRWLSRETLEPRLTSALKDMGKL